MDARTQDIFDALLRLRARAEAEGDQDRVNNIDHRLRRYVNRDAQPNPASDNTEQ